MPCFFCRPWSVRSSGRCDHAQSINQHVSAYRLCHAARASGDTVSKVQNTIACQRDSLGTNFDICRGCGSSRRSTSATIGQPQSFPSDLLMPTMPSATVADTTIVPQSSRGGTAESNALVFRVSQPTGKAPSAIGRCIFGSRLARRFRDLTPLRHVAEIFDTGVCCSAPFSARILLHGLPQAQEQCVGAIIPRNKPILSGRAREVQGCDSVRSASQ